MKRTIPALTLCALFAGKMFADGTTNVPILSLASAQEVALRNHPQIAEANYRALAAQEVVKETRSGYFPTANLYATAVGADSGDTRILAGGLNNPSVLDRAAGGVAVNQLITDFGRTANLTASSKAQAQAASQNVNVSREQVLLQVDTGYFGALQAQAVLHVAQQTLDTRQLLLDQITALATNKLRSELDVSFAQVELEQARLLLQKSQSDAAAAMATLSTALGYHEFHQFQLVEQPLPPNAATNDVSELVQTALSQRPELLSLRDERDAALRYAKSQRDSRLPTIAAVFYGQAVRPVIIEGKIASGMHHRQTQQPKNCQTQEVNDWIVPFYQGPLADPSHFMENGGPTSTLQGFLSDFFKMSAWGCRTRPGFYCKRAGDGSARPCGVQFERKQPR